MLLPEIESYRNRQTAALADGLTQLSGPQIPALAYFVTAESVREVLKRSWPIARAVESVIEQYLEKAEILEENEEKT